MGKRLIPVIITVIGVIFLLLWGSAPALGGAAEGMALVFMLIAAGLIGVLVANLIKRLREISEEDEDDLSKY